MTPLFILLLSFGLLFAGNKLLLKGKFGLSLIGRISMALMLVATGIAHFTSTDLMIELMPESLPAKREIIYFTGLCELLAVIGLLWNRMAKLTSVMLIIFFLAILPANIVGSIKEVQLGGMNYGKIYLLFRIPLQFFFILWVYYFGIKIHMKNDANQTLAKVNPV